MTQAEITATTSEQKISNDTHKLTFNTLTESDRYVYQEIYGPENSYKKEILLPLMRDGTVIEIGAHKGFFSLLAGSVAERVICFEPDAENYRYLLQNIKLNHMSHIVPVNKAVSSTEENRLLTVSNITAARHTLIASEFSGSGHTTEVACTTIPAILRDHQINRVRLLKVDCEGAEYDIFLNCNPDVFDKIDAIAIEIHETQSIPHRMTELLDCLLQLGYTGEIYDERTMGSMRVWMGLFTKPWVINRFMGIK